MRYSGLISIALVLGLAGGCADDEATDNGGTNAPVTSTYQGSLYDPVMDAALSGFMNYDSSWYIYKITTDNSYYVNMTFGMPAVKFEEGTWVKVGATYTFTPTAGWKSEGMGTMVPLSPDSLKPAYAGDEAGTGISFTDYINMQDLRNLGALTIWIQ